MTLLISGCMPAIYSILVSNRGILKVEDLRKSMVRLPGAALPMFDLDIQGSNATFHIEFILFSKWSVIIV